MVSLEREDHSRKSKRLHQAIPHVSVLVQQEYGATLALLSSALSLHQCALGAASNRRKRSASESIQCIYAEARIKSQDMTSRTPRRGIQYGLPWSVTTDRGQRLKSIAALLSS